MASRRSRSTSAISAVANAHAWDMLPTATSSHTSLDGRTKEDRLRNAGISFGWSGENICYSYNAARIADRRAQLVPLPVHVRAVPRVRQSHRPTSSARTHHGIGIGIAVSGAKVYIIWDFTD